jgi:hypothetical protein
MAFCDKAYYMKRPLLIYLFVYSNFVLSAQTVVEVKILNGNEEGRVKINDISNTVFSESRYKSAIFFNLSKTDVDCYELTYTERNRLYAATLWLDNGRLKVIARIAGNNLVVDTVLGSRVYYLAKRFSYEFTRLKKEKDTTKINKFLCDAILNNISTPFSLLAAYEYTEENSGDISTGTYLEEILKCQNGKFKWFLYDSLVEERLQLLKSLRRANLSTLSCFNSKHRITKIKFGDSDYYVIDIWFLHCVPCIKQHKEIRAAYAELKRNKIKIIGICLDKDSRTVKEYLNKNLYYWDNYIVNNDRDITASLRVTEFPTYLVTNKNGEILNFCHSFNEIREQFRKHP